MTRLDEQVALVTGSTRGVGKGIALALGDAGATVWVTGRTTVDETAAAVTARGGRGIGVRVDHSDDAQTEALFERIREESGRLDVAVANAWGGYSDHEHTTFSVPHWEQPLSRWQSMYEHGLRPTFTAARFATQIFAEQRRGLLVCTGGWDDSREYLGNVYYDVFKFAVARLVAGLAHEARPFGVAVVGVYPGFTRTEAVVDAFSAEGMEPPEEAHSPEYVGRAVAHLAADPSVLERSGAGAQASAYAAQYGFVDVDGRTFEPFRMPPENRLP